MESLRLPYERFRLKNGLEVILHRDDRLPRVAVNMLYRVGSRHDPPGRSGMAHLFEHLMFMGTKRVPENQFDLLMEELGGQNNAYTSEDLTDYYSVGPSHLLETFLWLEADRLSSLARSMTKKKLDLQREVVLNERRQSYEDLPYGIAYLESPTLLFPAGHPYSWPIIGQSLDIRAVTVRDVKTIFACYYSPSNASLVVAGHFDPERARALVEKYLQWIPAACPPPPSAGATKIQLRREVRQLYHDRVELAKLHFLWHSPALLQPGDAEMDLAASILCTGKRSRLFHQLVYEKQLALEVEAQQESRQLGSLFSIEVTAKPGVPLHELERATDEVLQEFMATPPLPEEMERALNVYEEQLVTQLERLSRRADLLNFYFATAGEPDFLARDFQRYRRVDRDTLQRWARKILRPEQRAVIAVIPLEGWHGQ